MFLSELLQRRYGRRQVMERTVEPTFHDLPPTVLTLK
jgi:hypothetical protein